MERGSGGCYKCPFIPIDCDSDVHVINKKNLLTIIGNEEERSCPRYNDKPNFSSIIIISLDKNDFMVPFMKFQIEIPIKRIQLVTGHQSYADDLVTVMIYEKTVGLIVVFFNANFKVIDPCDFQRVEWEHYEIDLKR